MIGWIVTVALYPATWTISTAIEHFVPDVNDDPLVIAYLANLED